MTVAFFYIKHTSKAASRRDDKYASLYALHEVRTKRIESIRLSGACPVRPCPSFPDPNSTQRRCGLHRRGTTPNAPEGLCPPKREFTSEPAHTSYQNELPARSVPRSRSRSRLVRRSIVSDFHYNYKLKKSSGFRCYVLVSATVFLGTLPKLPSPSCYAAALLDSSSFSATRVGVFMSQANASLL